MRTTILKILVMDGYVAMIKVIIVQTGRNMGTVAKNGREEMNDRYLFRGMRIDNGEWVVGYLLVLDEIDYRIATSRIESADDPPYFLLYMVDPNTVCQCTGLKDKTGKLIWENDILSGHIDEKFPEDETRTRVVWYENGWCTNEYGCEDYEELDDFDSENFEVIGNIIDNPELLEVKE